MNWTKTVNPEMRWDKECQESTPTGRKENTWNLTLSAGRFFLVVFTITQVQNTEDMPTNRFTAHSNHAYIGTFDTFEQAEAEVKKFLNGLLLEINKLKERISREQ